MLHSHILYAAALSAQGMHGIQLSSAAARKVQENSDFCTHTDQQESYTILLMLLPLTGSFSNLNRVTAHDLVSDPN